MCAHGDDILWGDGVAEAAAKNALMVVVGRQPFSSFLSW